VIRYYFDSSLAPLHRGFRPKSPENRIFFCARRAVLPFTVVFGVLMQFLQSLPVSAQTIGLLMLSNVFMTFAWYGHLKNLATSPWYIAALISWGIALFEYLLQVPGNRIGFTVYSVGQLKIMQEVITLTVFVPFAVFYLNEPLKLDYLWAALCMVGAVYFIFRSS
jgi:uncharacterized protein (DUF486 family)